MKPQTITLSTRTLAITAAVTFLAGLIPALFIGEEYSPLFGMLFWPGAFLVGLAIYTHKRLGGKLKITI